MDTIEVDQGEWSRIDWDVEDDPAPWDDLSGGEITLACAVDLAPGTPLAFACPRGVLDPPDPTDGKVKTGGVLLPLDAPPGTYWATLTVAKTGQDGWPQHSTFTLIIKPVVRANALPE